MLDINITPQINNYNSTGHKIFRMGSNERTAGSIPIWETPSTKKELSAHNFETALNNTSNQPNGLAYNNNGYNYNSSPNDEFSFFDIIDMVNPLHHVPIVGNIYRNITGDEIKPISKIIGGGLFTGPAGAASGLINTISEKETGKNITQNVKDLIVHNKLPEFKHNNNHPKNQINQALANINENPINNLPDTAISFADLSYIPENNKKQKHEYSNRYND